MPASSNPAHSDNMSTAEVLAEHYQKTNELTYSLRQERDKFFLFLLGALGAATLFNFDATASSSLLIAVAVKFLEIKDATVISKLQTSPLLEIIETLLLVGVFYLMSNLHQRNTGVLRNFQYLGAMEQEIRNRLEIKKDEYSFSREGGFYWQAREGDDGAPLGFKARWLKRIHALNLTKSFYTFFLALLLLFSFVLRIRNDLIAQNWFLAGVDTLIGIPTLIYWWSYARTSHNLDKGFSKKK